MAQNPVIPTRMELGRLKRKLEAAVRGHDLLKDRRDEMMRRFLELIRRNRMLRRETEEALREAQKVFALAAASMGASDLQTALLPGAGEMSLALRTQNIMGVEVPVFDPGNAGEREIRSFGYAFSSPRLDEAVRRMGEVSRKLFLLAQTEKTCQLLAAELESARRRVNTLEYLVIPQTGQAIRTIRMKLEENERSALARLRRAEKHTDAKD